MNILRQSPLKYIIYYYINEEYKVLYIYISRKVSNLLVQLNNVLAFLVSGMWHHKRMCQYQRMCHHQRMRHHFICPLNHLYWIHFQFTYNIIVINPQTSGYALCMLYINIIHYIMYAYYICRHGVAVIFVFKFSMQEKHLRSTLLHSLLTNNHAVE